MIEIHRTRLIPNPSLLMGLYISVIVCRPGEPTLQSLLTENQPAAGHGNTENIRFSAPLGKFFCALFAMSGKQADILFSDAPRSDGLRGSGLQIDTSACVPDHAPGRTRRFSRL